MKMLVHVRADLLEALNLKIEQPKIRPEMLLRYDPNFTTIGEIGFYVEDLSDPLSRGWTKIAEAPSLSAVEQLMSPVVMELCSGEIERFRCGCQHITGWQHFGHKQPGTIKCLCCDIGWVQKDVYPCQITAFVPCQTHLRSRRYVRLNRVVEAILIGVPNSFEQLKVAVREIVTMAS